MLILSRRVGETIMIGEDIQVTILNLHGGQVRVGVAAPLHIVVDRAEIAQRKAQGLQPRKIGLEYTLPDRLINAPESVQREWFEQHRGEAEA